VVAARSRDSNTARSFGFSRTSIASGIIWLLNHDAERDDSANVTQSLQIPGTRLARVTGGRAIQYGGTCVTAMRQRYAKLHRSGPRSLTRSKLYIVDSVKASAPDRIPAVVLFREIKARGQRRGHRSAASRVGPMPQAKSS
jgi:hypothetical protein